MHTHVCRHTCTDMYTSHCMYGNKCTLGCDLFENESRLQEQPQKTPSSPVCSLVSLDWLNYEAVTSSPRTPFSQLIKDSWPSNKATIVFFFLKKCQSVISWDSTKPSRLQHEVASCCVFSLRTGLQNMTSSPLVGEFAQVGNGNQVWAPLSEITFLPTVLP